MNDKNIDFLNTRIEQYKDRIHDLETELAAERVANETNAVKVYKLGKRVDELEAALRQIANGEGYYGAQAKEYKDIARAALGE